jgi:tRNA (cytidine/uridine-2'-O-)-methyltransferase
MFNVVLFQPEIPPNTGNVIRLCANTGCTLHLVRPIGFDVQEKAVRRAGLDYEQLAKVRIHASLDACLSELAGVRPNTGRVFCVETGGTRIYSEVAFQPGDTWIFGPETRGLPAKVLSRIPADRQLSIPMQPGNRSINLSNTVALVVYEAWRQQGFAGAADGTRGADGADGADGAADGTRVADGADTGGAAPTPSRT